MSLLYPIYTIQPVVNPVVQPAVSCKRTSNRLSSRFDNRLNVRIHDTAVVKRVWQPCWTNIHCSFNRLSNCAEQPIWQLCSFNTVVKPVVQRGLTTMLNEQPLTVQPAVKPGCTTGLTTGCIHDTAVCQTGWQTGLTTGCMVYTNIYPVVKPVWQQIASCKRGFRKPRHKLSNLFHLLHTLASTAAAATLNMYPCNKVSIGVPILAT